MDAGDPDQPDKPAPNPSYREYGLTVPWGQATPVQPTTAGRRTTRAPSGSVGRRPAVDRSITISEAARRLGVSTKTIRRRIADGSLAAHKAAGPGGFQYRVTDPVVMVVDAGSAPSLPTRARSDAGLDKQVSHVVLELSNRAASAEVRAARAEWERDALRAELESLRRAVPALVEQAPARSWRRWWWPFPVNW